jgi:hypothetical protein
MTGFNYINNHSLEIEYKNMYLKIPVYLCKYAFKNKVLKPFRLYILLTSATQGNVILTEKDEVAISLILGYKSKKSIKNNLSKLIALGWIGYDVKLNKYWIRGLDELRKRLKFKNRKAVLFKMEFFNDFNAFCFSAIIGEISLYQRWRRRLAQMRGGALQDLLSHSDYFPVGNRYLAKVLNFSISSASRYKREAKDAGYIDVKSSSRIVKIKPNELRSFKSNDYELYGKMYSVGESVIEPGPDLVKVCLTYSRRKKLDI